MKVIYGKGSVGESMKRFLDYLGEENYLMDDSDYNEEVLKKAEHILVSPGIPPFHSIYGNHPSKIKGELDFLYEFLEEKNLLSDFIFAGITGTDGKSTTSRITYSLLYKILDSAKYNTLLGGNFEKPVSELVLEILEKGESRKNIIVVEVSSFMGYNLESFRFDHSIWTNFHKDHLDWHRNMDEYLSSKQNIINSTTRKALLHKDLEQYSGNLKANTEFFDENEDFSDTRFLGKHNFANLKGSLLAVNEIIKQLGEDIKYSEIREKLQEVQPLDHRIKLVKQEEGIDIYDDGKSTTVNSLKVALESMPGEVVLIAGGSDKGDDFSLLKDIFSEKLGYGVFLGQMSGELAEIAKQTDKDYTITSGMEEAVKEAKSAARSNGIKYILFSPGCASFDMFKDRKDRVNNFLKKI